MNFPSIVLTDEQLQYAHKILSSRNPNYLNCYACGQAKVGILPYLSRYNFGDRESNEIAASVFSTSCSNCGIITSYSLRALQLDFDSPWDPADLAPESDGAKD